MISGKAKSAENYVYNISLSTLGKMPPAPIYFITEIWIWPFQVQVGDPQSPKCDGRKYRCAVEGYGSIFHIIIELILLFGIKSGGKVGPYVNVGLISEAELSREARTFLLKIKRVFYNK